MSETIQPEVETKPKPKRLSRKAPVPMGTEPEQGEGAVEAPSVEETRPSPKQPADYLRQYEVHRETGRPYWQLPATMPYIPPEKDSRAEAQKAFFLSQPRVLVIIPRERGQQKGTQQVPLTVNINGYRLDLPRGKYIEVPMDVATTVNDSQGQTDAAVHDHPNNLENLDKPGKEAALDM